MKKIQNSFCFKGFCIAWVVIAFLFNGARSAEAGFFDLSGDKAVAQDVEEQPFQAIQKPDPRVREKGAFALGRISPLKNRYMETYLAALDTANDDKALKTMEEMGELVMTLQTVVDVLVGTSRDKDPLVRFEVFNSLRLISEQIVPAVAPLKSLSAEMKKGEGDVKKAIVKEADKTVASIEEQIKKIKETMGRGVTDQSRQVRLLSARYMEVSRINPEDRAWKKPAEMENGKKESVGGVSADSGNDKENSGKSPSLEHENEGLLILNRLETADPSNSGYALIVAGNYIEKSLTKLEESIPSVKKGDIAVRIVAADSIVETLTLMEKFIKAFLHVSEGSNQETRAKAVQNLSRILVPASLALVPFDTAPKEIEDALTKEKIEADPQIRIQIDQFKATSDEGIEKITAMTVQVVPVLLAFLDDSSVDVREAAGDGLKGVLESVDEVNPLKPVWDLQFKKLAMAPVDIRIRILMNDLNDPGVNTARAAARAIGDLGQIAAKAVPTLIHVVMTKDNYNAHYKYVQVEAMEALGKIGGAAAAEAVPALIERLGDIRFEIRNAAVQAIGRIGGKDGLNEVIGVIEKDKSTSVRESAVKALANLDPSASVDKVYTLLFKALKDSSGEMRLNAFTALAAYELKNNGAGIIRWKASKDAVTGYRICSERENGASECVEKGPVTTFRLGELKNQGRGGKGVSVKRMAGDTVSDEEFTFIDVLALLEKSASLEKTPGIREKKSNILIDLMKKLLSNGDSRK